LTQSSNISSIRLQLLIINLLCIGLLVCGWAIGQAYHDVLGFSALVILAAFGTITVFVIFGLFVRFTVYEVDRRYGVWHKEWSLFNCVATPIGNGLLMLILVIGATLLSDWNGIGVPMFNAMTGVYLVYVVLQFVMVFIARGARR